MKRYKLTKPQAFQELSARLPGHELEALELMALAMHGATVPFLLIYTLTWNALTYRFEITHK